MRFSIFFLFCLINTTFAQIDITLQDSFKVFINKSEITLNQSWYDSLKSEANLNKLHYQIAGYKTSSQSSTAKLRIPQILTFNQVIRQVIFYYSLLNTDSEREKEKVMVYPLFIDVEEPEFVSCNYSNNTYYFHINKWETITNPSAPTPEDKFIYNQIMNSVLQDTLMFEEIPENAFEEVSLQQNKSIDEIYKIYKKVVLWNTVEN